MILIFYCNLLLLDWIVLLRTLRRYEIVNTLWDVIQIIAIAILIRLTKLSIIQSNWKRLKAILEYLSY